MIKDTLYNLVYMKKDIEDLKRNIDEETIVKNILGNIHPVYYERVFKRLMKEVEMEKLLIHLDFCKNSNIFKKYYEDIITEKILENMENEVELKKILIYINENNEKEVYKKVFKNINKETKLGYEMYINISKENYDLNILLKEKGLVGEFKELEKKTKIEKINEEIKEMQNKIKNLNDMKKTI